MQPRQISEGEINLREFSQPIERINIWRGSLETCKRLRIELANHLKRECQLNSFRTKHRTIKKRETSLTKLYLHSHYSIQCRLIEMLVIGVKCHCMTNKVNSVLIKTKLPAEVLSKWLKS